VSRRAAAGARLEIVYDAREITALSLAVLCSSSAFPLLADAVWLELRRQYITGISRDAILCQALDAIQRTSEAQKGRIRPVEGPAQRVGKLPSSPSRPYWTWGLPLAVLLIPERPRPLSVLLLEHHERIPLGTSARPSS
jgi:hypothetical protein